jgi:ABC-type bacteriocin/lantibiotic exporter with double-glycine peptidase domain
MEISRNSKKLKNMIKGKIEIKNITFKYESRETNLFNDLSLYVPEGSKVSFVGSSGCGKSTIM